VNHLYYGDNLDVLRRKIKDEMVDLCYIDPPFNSKRNYNQIYNNIGTEDRAQAQAFTDTWTWDEQAKEGYSEILANDEGRFGSQTVDLLKGLEPVLKKGSLFAYLVSMTLRITEIHRVLKTTGSFYLHCDPTASHYLNPHSPDEALNCSALTAIQI
jgi:site-specific DNA-methyltransferase (adenine-specific)